jgi:23S rRNA (cytosine1962-C5)-methyltransferase
MDLYQPIESALTIWLQETAPEARRFFHGRGHLHEGLEHINIDWYPPLLLITAYSEIQNISALISTITRVDNNAQVKSIKLQERFKKGAPATTIFGEELNELIVSEGNLNFEVHPGSHQNSGLFLDMRPLRQWLQKYSEGRNVLNLFAYTCALSVAALDGNARQVVNVDMSKPSIKWGEKNHLHNNQDLRSVRSVPHNVFRSWGRIKKMGPYQTIIIDPPSRQRGSFDAEKNYATVLKKLPHLAAPGADIIATINSPYLGPDFLINLMDRYGPKCTSARDILPSPEFEDKFPDKALKIVRFRVD